MVSRVLIFPSDTASVRPSRVSRVRARSGGSDAVQAKGPQLIYSRPAAARISGGSLSQARRIAQQVEQELAERVQRETHERFGTRRTHAFNLPPQVMEVNLRQRLLDALMFFARPA